MSQKPLLSELLLVSLYEACLWLDSKNSALTGVAGDSPVTHFPMVAQQLNDRVARLRHFYVVQELPPRPFTAHTVERYYYAWRNGTRTADPRTLAALRSETPCARKRLNA